MNIDSVLERIENDGGEKHWILPREAAEFYANFLSEMGAKFLVEIGTSVGYSAIWAASVVDKVVTVESNEKRASMAEVNLGDAGVLSKVELIRGHAPACFDDGLFELNEVDVLFIDCVKFYYSRIFNRVKDDMRVGSVIIADNILSHPGPVVDFIESVEGDSRFEFVIEEVGTGMLIAKKISL